jgi:iron complex outermembrane receptor protein
MKTDGPDRKDQQISPQIGLLMSCSRDYRINLQANFSRSFRVPTFADLFYQDFRVHGNQHLRPEKSWDFDAGIQLGIPWLDWFEMSAGYFRHRVENLIAWELGSFATWQPYNTDALLQGWEFGGSWQTWQDHIQLHASHVILNAVDKSNRHTTHDRRLPYRPQHTTKIGFEFNLNKIALHYKKRIVSRRYVTPSNTVSMPAYTVDDITLRAGRRFNRFSLNVKLTVYNLFDTTYEIIERAPLPGRYWRAELEAVL